MFSVTFNDQKAYANILTGPCNRFDIMDAGETLLKGNVKRIVLLLIAAVSAIAYLTSGQDASEYLRWAVYALCGFLALWYILKGVSE